MTPDSPNIPVPYLALILFYASGHPFSSEVLWPLLVFLDHEVTVIRISWTSQIIANFQSIFTAI
jgi:hypothetical protein